MFNVECIIKSSILKEILPIDVINKALVFVKSKDMSLLYNSNNPWIMSFNVKKFPLSKINILVYQGTIVFYA
jgi:hypothetical protein